MKIKAAVCINKIKRSKTHKKIQVYTLFVSKCSAKSALHEVKI